MFPGNVVSCAGPALMYSMTMVRRWPWGMGVAVVAGALEGGLKPDFCLRIDLAHKAQCGLTLKIININAVPVGLNNSNNIVEAG